MDCNELYQRVKRLHPDAGWTYTKKLINDALLEMRRYKVSRKHAKISVVEDQRYYPIGDRNSDLRIDKIYKVYYMDDDGEYVSIPRLINWQDLREGDIG